MSFRAGFSLFVILLIGVFALVNWTTISTPTTIDFLVASVQAPFGILFLILLAAIMLTYTLMAAFAEAKHLRESRAAAKEMERLHRLAEQAEDSRIAALREDLNRELGAIDAKLERLLADRAAFPPAAPGRNGLPATPPIRP
jgi:uncharacterized integral membrane protein